MKSILSRRFLIAGAVASLAVPLVSSEAGAQAFAPARDPWKGREITNSERIRVTSQGDHVARLLTGIDGIEYGMMDNHYRVRVPEGLLFVQGKDELSGQGVRLLTAMAPAFLKAKRTITEIVVHHGNLGNSYAAYVVSERRAEAVKAGLASRSVEPTRLKATGLGDRFPLRDETYVLGMNTRRTEFLIRPLA